MWSGRTALFPTSTGLPHLPAAVKVISHASTSPGRDLFFLLAKHFALEDAEPDFGNHFILRVSGISLLPKASS